ncbi:unnamed protein product [Periconia digitata]|uniref:Uncharacterized protein n=1 Tax=Periconia digitata TaxID=1303443 RepID=A0A9W4UAS7_9PLEO|nr:unnamed protein product [Periconia digitata]
MVDPRRPAATSSLTHRISWFAKHDRCAYRIELATLIRPNSQLEPCWTRNHATEVLPKPLCRMASHHLTIITIIIVVTGDSAGCAGCAGPVHGTSTQQYMT